MPATWCLDKFSRELRASKPEQWAALIDKRPEVCPRDCTVHCRAVCRDFAAMQWRMAKRRTR